MIVFLPPSFEIDENDSSNAKNVLISRVHKGPGLIVYEIEFDEPVPGNTSVVVDHWNRITQLYEQLQLTPLHQVPLVPAHQRIHIFAVVWSCGGECVRVGDNSYATVEVFDLTWSQRTVLKLWRRLARWSQVLQSGDCIQVRDVIISSTGLQSTSETQMFLLASSSSSKSLSSRASHLNSSESAILEFLKEKSLACPPAAETVNVNGFKPVALSKRIGDFWRLHSADEDAGIVFKHMDAAVWIKLEELVEAKFPSNVELSFEQLTRSHEFVPGSRMSFNQCASEIPCPNPSLTQSALDACTIFNGVISLRGQLHLHQLDPSNSLTLCTLNTLSQPDRLLLRLSDSDRQIILDNLDWHQECFKVKEHRIMVRTIIDNSESIIRKSYLLLLL